LEKAESTRDGQKPSKLPKAHFLVGFQERESLQMQLCLVMLAEQQIQERSERTRDECENGPRQECAVRFLRVRPHPREYKTQRNYQVGQDLGGAKTLELQHKNAHEAVVP